LRLFKKLNEIEDSEEELEEKAISQPKRGRALKLEKIEYNQKEKKEVTYT